MNRLFPDDEMPKKWFLDKSKSPDSVRCTRCEGQNVGEARRILMPYWCGD